MIARKSGSRSLSAMMLPKVSRSLVACNIYVSAGGHPSHRDLLLGLLGETQELCRLKNKTAKGVDSEPLNQRIVLVHAFRDGPYDRSSFHLAGAPEMVADVGSSLAVRAVNALIDLETIKTENKSTGNQRHPTVGLVDHVSVLPLDENGADSSKNEITGSVARTIGESLKSLGADVLYYGDAHPSGKELAQVRRDSTKFFEDNKSANDGARWDEMNSAGSIKTTIPVGQATVGAPHRFVENFNIRLRPGVSKAVARTLTECVRERGGKGLPFVEALTLAYGQDQYEIACNLLHPSVTSAKDIEDRAKDWEQQQNDGGALGLMDTAYRVGTTTDMCLEALQEVSTAQGEFAHNQQVLERLEGDFLSG